MGRIRKDDLLRISHAPHPGAEVQIVKAGCKAFLARCQDGAWVRVANGKPLPGASPVVGHVIGIVWRAA